MALFQRAGYSARYWVPLLFTAGCALSTPTIRQSGPTEAAPVALEPRQNDVRPETQPRGEVQQGAQQRVVASGQPASHRLPAVTPVAHIQSDEPLDGPGELSLPQLLADVEARNPSVQAMIHAWQAAAQRYPQAISLDDPMFMTMVAPASFGSNQVDPAYVLSGSQKLPWFGKRDLRGQAAQAEASAAFQDINETRLQVAQVTRFAFYDYYLVERKAELIDQNAQVMRQFRAAAQVKYENNQVTQQDLLQADVELTDIELRRIEIERMHRVAIARINTLLRRPPATPLQAPPRTLALNVEIPAIDVLQPMAVARRPDLAALAARVRAEEVAVDLALKQYYPDAEFSGRYDSFWQPAATQKDLRAQVAMNVNVPIYHRKLQAAVCEAQFRLSQRRAEYQQRLLDIQYDVESAYEQVQESRRAAELYAEKYLQFAERNVEAARSNYDVGQTSFLVLAQAQRQLIELREKYQQTLSDYHRRLAELERAIGTTVPPAARPEELPTPPERP
jgi:outer membrane protein, heavy metal efflux system